MTNHASRITSTAAVIQRPGRRSGTALLDDGRRRGSAEITVVRELLLAVLTAPPVDRAVGAPALAAAGGGGQLVVALAGLGRWLQIEGHLVQDAFLQPPGLVDLLIGAIVHLVMQGRGEGVVELGALREGPAEWRGIEGLTDLDELVLGALNGVGDDGGIRAIGGSAFEDRGGRRGVGGGVDQLLDRWLSILDTGLALHLDLVRIRVGAVLYRDGQATGIVR